MDINETKKNNQATPSIPLELSFIQPEWIYLSYIEEETTVQISPKASSQQSAEPFTPSTIAIHFRSRK